MLDKLGSSLRSTLKKIAGAVFLNEKLIDEFVKEIQRALLQADVNVKLVFELSKSIKERALHEKTPATITKREHLINIVYEELVKFLGEEKSEIKIEKKKPFKIMMIGLFGSGKTTSIGKIAKYYFKRGFKVAAIGLDVHRPGAMDQLKQVCDKIKIACFVDKKEKNPAKIYDNAKAGIKNYDLLLIDTSGRDALSKDLIREIENLNKTIKPDENLLVINADIGQAAESQARKFHESCGITGIFVTKMDGTGKAGGALSGAAVTGAKVKFIGTGEKPEDIEVFNPKGFVSRLLGMGDLEALLEKSQEALKGADVESLKERIEKGDFSLIDLHEQLQAMRKLGPLNKVMEMIPGIGKINLPKELVGVQEEKLKKWKFIMDSCTKHELEHPEEITRSRIDRIAKGAGVNASEVRELLKQYKQSKKLMKMMKGMGKEKDLSKLMKKFKGIKGMKI